VTLNILFAGLATGSVYGLLALGYHSTFIVGRTVNFSLGASLMIGAVMLWVLNVQFGITAFIAVPLVLLAAALLGVAVERIFVRPFARTSDGRESIAWLMTTIAFGIIAENVVRLTFGKELRSLPSPLAAEPLRIFGAGVYPIELLTPVMALLIALALTVVARRTLLGRALLAAAQNRDAAILQGIDVQKLIVIAYAVGTMLAALAGMLLAPKLNVSAGMGTLFGLKAFAAAIIGGLASAPGCVIAGVGYGLLEAVIAATLPPAFREIVGFTLVIVVLAIKPNGLFGRAPVYKV
jgi:branched-chain amino acid transport system permease protein